jgi:hypothetical protein
MKIFEQKHGRLNEDDRLTMARLLIKAGYTVRIGKEKAVNKSTAMVFIEVISDKERVEGGGNAWV